ncbi:MAG: winged helix-turn-helix domain-containing protein [Candidatus Limnocylindria bacterium]
MNRAATVIEAETGVPPRARVEAAVRQAGLEPQRPARRAMERDDEAIARWVAEEWPRIKGCPPTPGVDRLPRGESGVSLLPPVESHLGAAGPNPGAEPPGSTGSDCPCPPRWPTPTTAPTPHRVPDPARQLPNVPSWITKSRARAMGLPVSPTIRTAPSRNSESYFRRVSGITTPHRGCLHASAGCPESLIEFLAALHDGLGGANVKGNESRQPVRRHHRPTGPGRARRHRPRPPPTTTSPSLWCVTGASLYDQTVTVICEPI